MKQYKLTLSDKDAVIKNPDSEKDVFFREVEISILKFLIKEYANDVKDLEEFNYATSLLSEITDSEESGVLILTEKDLSNIKKGFASTKTKRTWIWTELKSLFDQLHNPEEYKKDEKGDE